MRGARPQLHMECTSTFQGQIASSVLRTLPVDSRVAMHPRAQAHTPPLTSTPMESDLPEITEDINTTSHLKTWDGTAIKASLFLRDISDFAEQRGWLSLLLHSYYTSKNSQIITASNDMIPILRAHFSGEPMQGDIQNPPLPHPATRDTTYVLSAEEKKTFTPAPELFVTQSAIVNSHILKAILNPDVQRRVREYAAGDARRALQAIVAIRGEITPAQITHMLARIAHTATTGITIISPIAVARWKKIYDDLVFCLPEAHQLPKTYIAQDYKRAILPLGQDFNMLVTTLKSKSEIVTLTPWKLLLPFRWSQTNNI